MAPVATSSELWIAEGGMATVLLALSYGVVACLWGLAAAWLHAQLRPLRELLSRDPGLVGAVWTELGSWFTAAPWGEGLDGYAENRPLTGGTLLNAIETTPRELFTPELFKERAFEDSALPIACGQTISQPFIVGLMTQALKIDKRDRVGVLEEFLEMLPSGVPKFAILGNWDYWSGARVGELEARLMTPPQPSRARQEREDRSRHQPSCAGIGRPHPRHWQKPRRPPGSHGPMPRQRFPSRPQLPKLPRLSTFQLIKSRKVD